MGANKPKFGGCQCGAVRYRADSLRDDSHICHCRMCQKAAGNFFLALVGVPKSDLTWTRGEPAIYMSSEIVQRGFCKACGTPLFFHRESNPYISMTTGSFDHPEDIPVANQYGLEARLPQMDQITDLKDTATTEEDMADDVTAIRASNHQHPDRETEQWPPGQ